MVARLYGAPVALSDLEGVLARREQNFRDTSVRMDRLRFDSVDGRLRIGRDRFRLQGQALDQFAARLRVPANYLRRLPPKLLAANLNWSLDQATEEEVLVRFDGSEVRALLSERYRPVSNLEVVKSLRTACSGDSPARYELSATRLALHVLRPDSERALLGGVSVQNSETGHCVVEMSAMLWRRVCSNGLVIADGAVSVRRRHTRESGATLEELKRTMAEAWPSAMSHIDRFDGMRAIRANPVEPLFERIGQVYALNEQQATAVREAYLIEPEENLFGIINALTRAGNCPKLQLEERTYLQEVGGKVMASAESGRLWN